MCLCILRVTIVSPSSQCNTLISCFKRSGTNYTRIGCTMNTGDPTLTQRLPNLAIIIRQRILCKSHLYANYENSNLDHRIKIQGGRRGSGRGDLQKCDYLIQGRVVNCKITPFPYPLDVDSVVQIQVCIISTERLVCTRYIPKSSIFYYRKIRTNLI